MIRNRLPSAVTPNSWPRVKLSPYGNNLLGTVVSIFGPVPIWALIRVPGGSRKKSSLQVTGRRPSGTERALHNQDPFGRRVVDRSVLRLIRMWLEAPVVERSEDQGGGSKWSRPKKGTPQGGVASPLLANLYLHWFDALFHGPEGPARRADVKLVRYADDFVALAKQMGSETIEFVESRLEGKFQLEINREKTRVVDLREQGASLNFLGYTFRYDRDRKGRDRKYLNVLASNKAV